MSTSWTDYLSMPLAKRLDGRDWLRVDVDRGGGWNLLERRTDGPRWHRLESPEADLLPLSALEDRGLPQLTSVVARFLDSGYSVSLLAHKPGRRAVLKLERDDCTLVAKVYRRDRNIERRWQHLQGALGDHWRAPELMEWSAEERTLVMEYCAGATLHDEWVGGTVETGRTDSLVELLQAIRRVPLPRDFPEHGHAEEVEILRRRLQEFEAIVAVQLPQLRELTDRVTGALAEDPRAPMTCGHRDLYDKQLLPRGSGGVLIDLDLVARTPPSLDTGNLLAHLRLRGLQNANLRWQQIASGVSGPMLRDGGHGSLHRWTAASLLRLALIYCRRRGGPPLVDRLLESAEQALNRRGEWSDLL